MISLDTNLLVRYFVEDDLRQARMAAEIIDRLTAEEPAYVAEVVIIELCWVLAARYKYSDREIASLLMQMFASEQLVIENSNALQTALLLYQEGHKVQFADAVIVVKSKAQGAEPIYTLDKSARSVGMTVCG